MAPEEEELVDYEDELPEETPAATGAAATEGAAATNGAAGADADKKGSYVGIHSTGFR
jgi:ATP-dependent RNA helicase UAP56/SUB2